MRKNKLTSVKARILMSLINMDSGKRSVTYLADNIGVSKSTISRAVDWLESRHFLAREENKDIVLLPYGMEIAEELERRKYSVSSWLRTNGISVKAAIEDIESIYLSCSDETIEIMREQAAFHDARRQISDVKNPFPSEYCRAFDDGDYKVDFAFYKFKDRKSDGAPEISMANKGFFHPAILRIKGNDGYIIFNAGIIQERPISKNIRLKGTVRNMYYDDDKGRQTLVSAGDEYIIPFDSFTLMNISENSLIAYMKLYIESTVSHIHMPISPVKLFIYL